MILFLAALLHWGLVASACAASFQGLGDLPGGNSFSVATGVSADGQVVVGYSSSTLSGVSGFEAFRWTAAHGMVGLGDLPGGSFSSFANAVSADGTVVVGYGQSSSGDQAFRWTQAGGLVGVGDLPGGSLLSIATGVSGDGDVVVGYSASGLSGTRYEAFRWTPANGMEALGDLPGGAFNSRAFAVSADGSTIVGESSSSNTPGGVEAFRWKAGTGMVGLGDLPGGITNSNAYGVSADGSVVVGNGYPPSNVHEAFRWTAATGLVPLGFNSCDWSIARAVSGDGSVIVGDPQTTSCQCVFIWEAPHGLRDLLSVLVNDYGLNLTGWQLCRATALSFDGTTIVGYGTNPAGQTEAWIANLKPPLLEIARTGNHVLLSWKTGSPNFLLEQTSALASSNRWESNSEVVNVVGDHFEVTHSPTGGQQFFRLRKP